MEQQHDFTKGPILPLLLRFALPVLLALLLRLFLLRKLLRVLLRPLRRSACAAADRTELGGVVYRCTALGTVFHSGLPPVSVLFCLGLLVEGDVGKAIRTPRSANICHNFQL